MILENVWGFYKSFNCECSRALFMVPVHVVRNCSFLTLFAINCKKWLHWKRCTVGQILWRWCLSTHDFKAPLFVLHLHSLSSSSWRICSLARHFLKPVIYTFHSEVQSTPRALHHNTIRFYFFVSEFQVMQQNVSLITLFPHIAQNTVTYCMSLAIAAAIHVVCRLPFAVAFKADYSRIH